MTPEPTTTSPAAATEPAPPPPRPWYRLHALSVFVMLGVAAAVIFANAGVQKSMRSGSGNVSISREEWKEFESKWLEPGPEVKNSLAWQAQGLRFEKFLKAVQLNSISYRPEQCTIGWTWTAEHREWGFPRPIYSEDDYSPEKVADGIQTVLHGAHAVNALSDDFPTDSRWSPVGLTLNLVVFLAVVGLAGLLADRLIRYLISRIMGWRAHQVPSPLDDTHDGVPDSPAWDEAKNR